MKLTRRLKQAQDLSWWDMRHMPGILRDPTVQDFQSQFTDLGFEPSADSRFQIPETADQLRRQLQMGQRGQRGLQAVSGLPFFGQAAQERADAADRMVQAGTAALPVFDYIEQFVPEPPEANQFQMPTSGMFGNQGARFNQLPASVRQYASQNLAHPEYRKALSTRLEHLQRNQARASGGQDHSRARVTSQFRAPGGSLVTTPPPAGADPLNPAS